MGTSPWPVTMITGSSASSACRRSSSAKPSMPGMRTSLTTTPAKSGVSSASASSARAQVRTLMSESSSHCCTASRIGASSSMKMICCMFTPALRRAV
ncbi:hypothetical protein D3C84_368830 [compost metagenome]